MLGKATFDESVNVLERYCKGDIYKTLITLFPKLRFLKGLILCCVCACSISLDCPNTGCINQS